MVEEKTTPEEFSPLALYGDRETFQKMRDSGFVSVALGSSKEAVNDVRIVALWAFTNPDDNRVAVYGTRKSYAFGNSSRGSFEQEFTSRDAFQKFCRDNTVSVGPTTNLEELLGRWAS